MNFVHKKENFNKNVNILLTDFSVLGGKSKSMISRMERLRDHVMKTVKRFEF